MSVTTPATLLPSPPLPVAVAGWARRGFRYSFFTGLGFEPPTVCFGSIHSSRDGGAPKDTHRNLVETGECVVHIISEW